MHGFERVVRAVVDLLLARAQLGELVLERIDVRSGAGRIREHLACRRPGRPLGLVAGLGPHFLELERQVAEAALDRA